MTLGGGIFTTMDKIIPGSYYKIQTNATMNLGLLDRGIVVTILKLSWGNSDEVLTVLQKNLKNFMLNADNDFKEHGGESPELFPIREILTHANTCYVIPTGGEKAEVKIKSDDSLPKFLTFTALKSGTLGNQFKILLEKKVVPTTDDSFTYRLIFYDMHLNKIIKNTDWLHLDTLDKLRDFLTIPGNYCTNNLNDLIGTNPYESTFLSHFATEYTTDEEVNEHYHNFIGGTSLEINEDTLTTCLQTIQTKELNYNVLVINYQPDFSKISEIDPVQQKFIDFIIDQREKYGNLITGFLYDIPTDNEYITSVGYLDQEQKNNIIYWVAGISAAAQPYESLTNYEYDGELTEITSLNNIDTVEKALKNGRFIFYHQLNKYRIVQDINSFHSEDFDITKKSKKMKKNIVIRLMDQILKEVMNIFSTNYLGKAFNTDINRLFLKHDVISILEVYENYGALYDVETDDVTIGIGEQQSEVTISITLKPLDVMEYLYITLVIDENSGVYL